MWFYFLTYQLNICEIFYLIYLKPTIFIYFQSTIIKTKLFSFSAF